MGTEAEAWQKDGRREMARGRGRRVPGQAERGRSQRPGGDARRSGTGAAVPGERSLVWLAERERGRLWRKRFILLKPRGSSASDMVSSDSAEA